MTIKVLVADDHNLFRQGLISLIKTRSNEVEVIGEAATGKETIRLAKELQPDVILMDIYMPEGGGLEATKLIKEEFPGIIIVILTSSEEDKHIYEAVQLGASGYLLKSLNANELFDLLNGVIRGEAAMTRAMASRLLKTVAKQSTENDWNKESLSEREIEVLKLVARGATNLQIAEELCISINTVKSHLKSILGKLQLGNRTQAAAYAVKVGLVSTTNDNK